MRIGTLAKPERMADFVQRGLIKSRAGSGIGQCSAGACNQGILRRIFQLHDHVWHEHTIPRRHAGPADNACRLRDEIREPDADVPSAAKMDATANPAATDSETTFTPGTASSTCKPSAMVPDADETNPQTAEATAMLSDFEFKRVREAIDVAKGPAEAKAPSGPNTAGLSAAAVAIAVCQATAAAPNAFTELLLFRFSWDIAWSFLLALITKRFASLRYLSNFFYNSET